MMAQVQMGRMPVMMAMFIEDAGIAFYPQFQGTLLDGLSVWQSDGFSIDGEQYEYGVRYTYKEEPKMLEYLKSLQMDLPVFGG